jgi:hypothetical protein
MNKIYFFKTIVILTFFLFSCISQKPPITNRSYEFKDLNPDPLIFNSIVQDSISEIDKIVLADDETDKPFKRAIFRNKDVFRCYSHLSNNILRFKICFDQKGNMRVAEYKNSEFPLKDMRVSECIIGMLKSYRIEECYTCPNIQCGEIMFRL